MASFAQGLASIAARPPTPPKESTARLSPGNGFNTAPTDHLFIHTPDESPSSSAENYKDSTGKAQKKVGFTLLGTRYHRFSVGGQESGFDGQIRQLPRSRDCKSSKSILKAFTDTAENHLSDEMLAFDNTNLAAMLRSTTQHLECASRSSRLDAYSTLLACLSAYDEVPEGQELAEKVAEITAYLRRDIAAKHEDGETPDVQLATQALKLIAIFLCTPRIAVTFQEDFCSFVLERSIKSIEDEASPKMLVSHYMHVLEKQKFATKFMTIDRVNRLFSALDTVTARIKGNRVVGHRLMIYQRLLGQAKSSMISRAGSWIDHLISGMLSTMKDIRARAIAFGMDASLLLGTTSSVSQACLELFNRATADGTKVIDFVSSRLTEMANSKEDGTHIPQIWTVIIMFLRSRRHQLQSWEHFRSWIVIIQCCFNSSDWQTKLEANSAWNRLIFAINLDMSTSISMAKMLRQPIVSQLERRYSDKNHKMAKQITRSSYCVLLYYALRPAAPHSQLDQYWDLYVDQILPSCFTANKSNIDDACDILSALFSGNGKPKVWEDNKVINGAVNAEDLPCLDPKWLRLRAARILRVFDKLFDIADWQMSNKGDAPILRAWRNFTLALGSASGKEIKVSMDAMNAVAAILNEIKLLLERSKSRLANERTARPIHTASGVDHFDMFEKIRMLTNEVVANIGSIPFLERRLIRTSQDSFEAAETPSRRSNIDSGSLNSPVAHLLNLLLENVQCVPIATSYINALETVLSISVHPTKPRRTQLGVLRNFGRLITLDGVRQGEASNIFWRLLAESTSSALRQPQQNQPHEDSPQFPGHEFRDAVKILELGVQLHSNHNGSTWHDLHTRIVDVLRNDVGDDAIGLILIEPLAGTISKDERCDDFVLAAAASMLGVVQWPRSPYLMEQAQHRLWGVTNVAPKVPSQDPFDKLYSMMAVLLCSSYASLDTLPSATAVNFISATTKIIASCPPDSSRMVLARLQRGLATWIEDAKGFLSMAPSSPHRSLNSEINTLWTVVISWFERSVVFDTRSLYAFQEILIAGFQSRHRSIVNKSIAMWNNTFGGADLLEYPEGLKTILRKLKSMAELRLPNFPDLTADELTLSPLHFIDYQDEEDMQVQPAVSLVRPSTSVTLLPSVTDSPKRLPSVTDSPKRLPRGSDSRKAAASQGSPSPARTDVKTTPKARLRHDDSQIHFTAIESSPLHLESVESQYLTDRQKEIKERQAREAAAMFPEIKSSPLSTSGPTGHHLPKPDFKSAHHSAPKPAIDEPIPAYLQDPLMDGFLGSSPTPSSKRSSDRRSDDNSRSSPPFISPYPQMDEMADVPLVHSSHAPVEAMEDTEDYSGGRIAVESVPSTKDFSSNLESIGTVLKGQRFNNDQGDASKPQEVQVPIAACATSDPDIYVDAPSVPLSTEHGDNQDSNIISSFHSETSSQFSIEDEQVTAQLFTEMERASSQKSGDRVVQTGSAGKTTNKRKRHGDSHNMSKKTKRIPASLDPQTAAQIPRTGEMVADCVLIDVHEVDRWRKFPSQQIKREMSASPSMFTSSQAVEETAVAQDTPAGNFGNSGAGLPSDQNRESPTRAKKAIGRPRGCRNSNVKLGESEKVQDRSLRQSTRVSERMSASTTSSPHSSLVASQDATEGEQWLALGKTPRKGMFKWLQRSCAESGSPGTHPDATARASSPANACSSEDVHRPNLSPADQTCEQSIVTAGECSVAVAEGRDRETQTEARGAVESEGNMPTTQGILQNCQNMLDQIKHVRFGPEEERCMVRILFESLEEVHEAGRRHIIM